AHQSSRRPVACISISNYLKASRSRAAPATASIFVGTVATSLRRHPSIAAGTYTGGATMFAEFPSWLQAFGNNRGNQKARASQKDGTAEPRGTPWTAEEESRLQSALNAIPASDYDVWIRVGMALHHLQWDRSDGTSIGFDLWHEYSARCPEKYSP